MNYNVIQNAITIKTQEQFPDGIISKVGNDKYTLDEAITKWHQQCVVLRNDADTLCYTCKIIDSQLDAVGDYKEFVDKRPAPELTPNEE